MIKRSRLIYAMLIIPFITFSTRGIAMYSPTLYSAQQGAAQQHFHLSNDDNQLIIEKISELNARVSNAYNASLPLMASAELGNNQLYSSSLDVIRKQLSLLDEPAAPDSSIDWMKNNSFKAWMWGRILLSAKAMNDQPTLEASAKKLVGYLGEKPTPQDNLAFSAWARGYLAALDHKNYDAQRQALEDEGDALSAIYASSVKQDDLSNALWAWVMDIQAAALANDADFYNAIKGKMMQVTGQDSVSGALENGLICTEKSSDYPAWAMAKVRLAAAMMHDESLVGELENPVQRAIVKANESKQIAEATLAQLDERSADQMIERPQPAKMKS